MNNNKVLKQIKTCTLMFLFSVSTVVSSCLPEEGGSDSSVFIVQAVTEHSGQETAERKMGFENVSEFKKYLGSLNDSTQYLFSFEQNKPLADSEAKELTEVLAGTLVTRITFNRNAFHEGQFEKVYAAGLLGIFGKPAMDERIRKYPRRSVAFLPGQLTVSGSLSSYQDFDALYKLLFEDKIIVETLVLSNTPLGKGQKFETVLPTLKYHATGRRKIKGGVKEASWKVRSLGLKNCHLSNEDLFNLPLGGVGGFYLNDNNISGELGVSNLLSYLNSEADGITWLDLSGNPIGNDGAEHLARHLKQSVHNNPLHIKPEFLGLSRAQIGATGAKALTSAIKDILSDEPIRKYFELKRLTLQGNDIGEECEQLASVIRLSDERFHVWCGGFVFNSQGVRERD